MRTQSMDTSPEAERMLINLIRKAPITKRFDLVRSWTKSITLLNQRNIRERYPNADEKELAFLFVSESYGLVIVDEAHKNVSKLRISSVPDLLITLNSIIRIFEQLQIPYYIGGSIASSTYGMRQAARDIDFVADLKPTHVPLLVKQLQASYYIDKQLVYEAVNKHTFFNIIHFDTLLKVDVIIPKLDEFDQQTFPRARQYKLTGDNRSFCVMSPEDVILVKLKLYRDNGEIDDAQWNDILGVLKVQHTSLDFAYLEQWATIFEIRELLERVYIDAGLKEDEI